MILIQLRHQECVGGSHLSLFRLMRVGDEGAWESAGRRVAAGLASEDTSKQLSHVALPVLSPSDVNETPGSLSQRLVGQPLQAA